MGLLIFTLHLDCYGSAGLCEHCFDFQCWHDCLGDDDVLEVGARRDKWHVSSSGTSKETSLSMILSPSSMMRAKLCLP